MKPNVFSRLQYVIQNRNHYHDLFILLFCCLRSVYCVNKHNIVMICKKILPLLWSIDYSEANHRLTQAHKIKVQLCQKLVIIRRLNFQLSIRIKVLLAGDNATDLCFDHSNNDHSETITRLQPFNLFMSDLKT